MEITKQEVKSLLYAESTNASRTFVRNDGVSEFEQVVIDDQVYDSLMGAWKEATSKLAEKMHEFLTGAVLADNSAQYVFARTEPIGAADNARMYVVNYMMADWLASVRPDFRAKYMERANIEMDDLLRKLYKKESPV
jgi:hypothetical protein